MSVIGVDIDGCLADFNTAYIYLVKEVTDKDLFPVDYNKDVIQTWSYPESFGYTAKEVSAVWEVIKQRRDFWEHLLPCEGARDFLADLNALDSIDAYFITSRVGNEVKWQSEKWLMANGWQDMPTVLISSEKGLCCKALKVNFYIDDKLENSIDVHDQSPATRNYLLAQPWNRPITLQQDGCVVPRINHLQEFLDGIKG